MGSANRVVAIRRAEGIKEYDQPTLLEQMGCQTAPGFLMGKPSPPRRHRVGRAARAQEACSGWPVCRPLDLARSLQAKGHRLDPCWLQRDKAYRSSSAAPKRVGRHRGVLPV